MDKNSILFDKLKFDGEHEFSRTLAKDIYSEIVIGSSLHLKNKNKVIEAIQHYVCNFYEANEQNCSVGISRNDHCYRIPARYGILYFKYDIMIPLMDLFKEFGYINIKLGHHDAKTGRGDNTQMFLTQKTKRMFENVKLNVQRIIPKEMFLQLKDKNKKLIDFGKNTVEITREIYKMNYEIEFINEFNNQNDFTINGIKQKTELYRVFNNSSWKDGGRFYGSMQNVKRELRSVILINGQKTVELDFSAMHPTMLYNMINVQMNKDVYYFANSEYPRAVIKKFVLITVNAKNKRTAKFAFIDWINKEWNEEYNEYRIEHPNEIFDEIDDIFCENNPDIMKFMYSNCGLNLQFHDANIMSKILLKCVELNIPCYPIHDSVIVIECNEDVIKNIMLNEYQNYMIKTFDLKITPQIKIKKATES